MKEERAMHHRVVGITGAVVQIVGIKSMQAFVVAHGPRSQIPEAAYDSQQENREIDRLFPIWLQKLSK